jgi:hypothetical protein
MTRQDDLRLHFGGPGDSGIKVVKFKPQEHAIAIGPVIGIPNRAVVVFDLKAVQLEDQHSPRNQPLIIRPPVRALTAEEALIPPAARFNVGHCDEWLRTHKTSRRRARPKLKNVAKTKMVCKWSAIPRLGCVASSGDLTERRLKRLAVTGNRIGGRGARFAELRGRQPPNEQFQSAAITSVGVFTASVTTNSPTRRRRTTNSSISSLPTRDWRTYRRWIARKPSAKDQSAVAPSASDDVGA